MDNACSKPSSKQVCVGGQQALEVCLLTEIQQVGTFYSCDLTVEHY
jgi:hypothetical protein